MATLLICCNTDAISCVRDAISTIYWVLVLTAKTPNRKVTTSLLSWAAVFRRGVREWNHLSKRLLMITELPLFMVRLNHGISGVEIPSFLPKGEPCA